MCALRWLGPPLAAALATRSLHWADQLRWRPGRRAQRQASKGSAARAPWYPIFSNIVGPLFQSSQRTCISRTQPKQPHRITTHSPFRSANSTRLYRPRSEEGKEVPLPLSSNVLSTDSAFPTWTNSKQLVQYGKLCYLYTCYLRRSMTRRALLESQHTCPQFSYTPFPAFTPFR